MFDLSKKTDYGMELMVALAKNYPKGTLSLKEIAKDKKLPLKFLEQIAGQLRDACLIEAKEGKGGGYFLNDKPKNISVAEIVAVLEGADMFAGCAGCAKAGLCSHEEVWQEVKGAVQSTMEDKSLADLIKK